MASGPVVGGDGAKENKRFIENKVYTRKAFKGVKRKSNGTANNNSNNVVGSVPTPSTNDTVNNSDTLKESREKTLGLEDVNLAVQPVVSRGDVAVSEDSSNHNRQQQVVELATPSTPEVPIGNSNGEVKTGFENQAEDSLALRSKQDKLQLRRKLKDELVRVRSLVTRIEAKEREITEFHNLRISNAASAVSDGLHNESGGGLTFVNSEVASSGVPRMVSRQLNQLRVSVLGNNQVGGEIVEKEKRTPKANPLYRNSEFLLANDKFPPAESNKKSKAHHKKQGGGELGNPFGTGSKCFKNCSSLLEKLMKHKHGWVFNSPVDPQSLGLYDYFTIINHPMDLGTIKLRLNKHFYKSPKEFADDVRLTFYNAMTYNPKGQDVHVMAEQLLRIFEDRWATIESDYNREMRFGLDYSSSLYSLPSRLAPPRPPPLDMQRILERSESMMPRPKPMMLTTPSSRTPASKKPKAKDPHKRDMTYEEKQKLSTNLQSLPPEKLDNIVQIIKKRNSAVLQQDDEIEVDIDSVDAETLWELDRFVTNHKKILSKKKRKAELIQARIEAEQNVQYMASTPTVAEAPKGTRTDDNRVSASTIQGEKERDSASGSSSSSSSSSDSGSSSSDSDSDSSSASRSDAEHSPRT